MTSDIILDEALNKLQTMESYAIGVRDERVWGWFEVTDVGYLDTKEEYCEKKIGISPRQALSLQRHQGRKEVWFVEQGSLTIILNGEVRTLEAGELILIPFKAAHCMINLTDTEVIVKEKQIGICREDDNDRLHDLNGRTTVPVENDDLDALKSIEIYKDITSGLLFEKSQWYAGNESNQR